MDILRGLLNISLDDFKLQGYSDYESFADACKSVVLAMYNAHVLDATNLLIYGAAAATSCCAFATIYYTKIKWQTQRRTASVPLARHSPTRDLIDRELLDVHHISGSLNPTEKKLVKCIYILNLRPEIVNCAVSTDHFTPFLRACWSSNTPLVRYMLQNGAKLQSRLSTGENAVFLAAYRVLKTPHWNSSVLDLLHAAGCEVDAVNAGGRSALHLAAAAGHVALARWLIDHGALRSPLHLFRRQPDPYQLAVAHDDQNHQCVACLIHLNCPQLFIADPQNRPIFY